MALGQPLQETAGLLCEFLQVYQMMPLKEFLVYVCMEFLKLHTLLHKKNNPP